MLTRGKLQNFVSENFPQYPLLGIENPEIRAMRHQKNGRWTVSTAAEAASEFMIDVDCNDSPTVRNPPWSIEIMISYFLKKGTP